MNGGDAHLVDGVLEERLLRWIIELAPRYRWTGREGLDGFSLAIEGRALLAEFEQALRHPEVELFIERCEDAPVAATFLTKKPMETESFGCATASLSYVVCDPETDDRRDAVRRLLRRAVSETAERGIELLMLRVSASDVETLAAAQSAGFQVVETTVTYLGDAGTGADAPELPDGITVEVHEGTPDGVLREGEIAELASETSGWALSRFRADPNLDDDVVDRYYRSWVPNIASGQFSDCLYVARHRGALAGIYAENTDRELLDLTGTTLRVGAWMVVVRRGLGVGRALMRSSTAHRFPGGRFHENETQVHNIATIRCLDHMRIIRSGYTLHAWPRRR